MIIYLIRPPEIAACEDERHAARYLRQGYTRVDHWRFVYWWSLRDDRAFARMRGAAPMRERAVGGWRPVVSE